MARTWLGKTQLIQKLSFGLVVGITAIMMVLSWVGPAFLLHLEDTFLDFRFKLRGTRQTGDEIILVAIDEKSLQEVGRWPWSRDKQARLLDAISSDGAKVIGLDIIYAEPEATEYLQGLRELSTIADQIGAGGPFLVLEEILKRGAENSVGESRYGSAIR